MPRKPTPIDTALRKAIAASGETHYGIARDAGISPSMIDRFMLPTDDPRHRDIQLSTAAKIAAVLGLEITSRAD